MSAEEKYAHWRRARWCRESSRRETLERSAIFSAPGHLEAWFWHKHEAVLPPDRSAGEITKCLLAEVPELEKITGGIGSGWASSGV